MSRSDRDVETGLQEARAIVDQGIRELGGPLDLTVAGNALRSALNALRATVTELEGADFTRTITCGECGHVMSAKMSPKDIGQTAAYTAKVVDELYRLMEFSQGKADSRPDIGIDSLLELLSNEQFNQVCQWVEEAKKRNKVVVVQ